MLIPVLPLTRRDPYSRSAKRGLLTTSTLTTGAFLCEHNDRLRSVVRWPSPGFTPVVHRKLVVRLVAAVASVGLLGGALLWGVVSLVDHDLTGVCRSPDDYTYPMGSCQPEVSTDQISSGQVEFLTDDAAIHTGELLVSIRFVNRTGMTLSYDWRQLDGAGPAGKADCSGDDSDYRSEIEAGTADTFTAWCTFPRPAPGVSIDPVPGCRGRADDGRLRTLSPAGRGRG